MWYCGIYSLYSCAVFATFNLPSMSPLSAFSYYIYTYHLCRGYICCLLKSVPHFVCLSVSMETFNRWWHSYLRYCLCCSIMIFCACQSMFEATKKWLFSFFLDNMHFDFSSFAIYKENKWYDRKLKLEAYKCSALCLGRRTLLKSG